MGFMLGVEIPNFTKTNLKNSNYHLLYIFHDHLWATSYNYMLWSTNG
jgi:hypothetical protein